MTGRATLIDSPLERAAARTRRRDASGSGPRA
jgi:hypothetical protein